MDIKNLVTIRQSYANAVFTHKVQEIAAERQEQKGMYIKIGNIILVTFVLVLLVLQASNPSNIIFSYIATGVTVAEVIFLIIQLTFSFEQKAVQHKNIALKYLSLRDSFRLLITDIMNDAIGTDMLKSKRDLLQHEYQIISELAPQTGKEEYNEAQKRLNKKGVVEGEGFTWSDEEIDRFLPEALRLNKKK